MFPAFAQMENAFTRDKVNDGFKVNNADADYLYNYLYAEEIIPFCMDAADINDDGVVRYDMKLDSDLGSIISDNQHRAIVC